MRQLAPSGNQTNSSGVVNLGRWKTYGVNMRQEMNLAVQLQYTDVVLESQCVVISMDNHPPDALRDRLQRSKVGQEVVFSQRHHQSFQKSVKKLRY